MPVELWDHVLEPFVKEALEEKLDVKWDNLDEDKKKEYVAFASALVKKTSDKVIGIYIDTR